jgi:cell division protein ZapA (FtsZ GTPase activity inhibitor)
MKTFSEKYPVFMEMVLNRIGTRLNRYINTITEYDKKLSTASVNSISAAIILKQYGEQLDEFKKLAYSGNDIEAQNFWDNEYQEFIESNSPAQILIDLTNTRTLITDIDKYGYLADIIY